MKPFRFAVVGLLLMLWITHAAAQSIAEHPFPIVKGGALSMNDLKGKVVLVNFWATWCPPCRDEIPDLRAMQNRFGSQGLQVVGANFMDTVDKDDLARFIDEFSFNYPVITGAKSDMRALAQHLGGIMGLPTSFFINREGKVTYIHTGSLDEAQLIKILQPMLGQ
ncbi:MAG: TlpA family protein disulfide reductase [Magnetococcales bacterium]|nr:TlpA family protein disulfide reductase [Magnetococcales bacterium]NGZ25275.1 TlpA family protein disulfide reductase [Magnetococcales bacterium]